MKAKGCFLFFFSYVLFLHSVNAQEATEEKNDGGKVISGDSSGSIPAGEGEESEIGQKAKEENLNEKSRDKDREVKLIQLKLFMQNMENIIVNKCQKLKATERKVKLDISVNSSGKAYDIKVAGSILPEELKCIESLISNFLFPSADYNYKFNYTITMPSSKTSTAKSAPLNTQHRIEPAKISSRESGQSEEVAWPGYTTKGNVEISGELEFYFQQNSFQPNDNDSSKIEADSYRLAFSPSVSYFFANFFAFGVGTKIIFERISESNNFYFLFYLSPAFVGKIGSTVFLFFNAAMGASARGTDLSVEGKTISTSGGFFHIGALLGLAFSVSKNLVIKTGPLVTYEIGISSNGEDFKAQNILAGFSMGFSFYIPTKRSFEEAERKFIAN